MPEAVYILCALAGGVSAVLLTRAYLRSRERLLLWSSLCFVFLAISHVLLMVDLAVLPTSTDLSLLRTIPTVIGVTLMLVGLIGESR